MSESPVAERACARQAWSRVALLAAADLATFALAWTLAVWGYRALGPGYYKFGADFYLRLWPAAVAFVAINAAFRLYHGNVLYPAAPVSPVQEFRRLAESSAITHIGVIAYLALAYQTTENYSRAVIVISGLLVAVLSQTVRDVFRRVAFKAGVAQIPVVVAGSGPQAERVRNALARDKALGKNAPARLVKRHVFNGHQKCAESAQDERPRFGNIDYLKH